MTLEELKAKLENLSAEDFAEIQAWMDEKARGEELKRRIDEAKADPSLLVSHEEVMARGRAEIEKRREAQVSSGSE